MISGGSLEYTRSLPVVPKKLRLLPKLGTTPVFSVRRTGRVLSPTGGTAVVLAVAEGAAGITGVPTRVLSSTAGRTCVLSVTGAVTRVLSSTPGAAVTVGSFGCGSSGVWVAWILSMAASALRAVFLRISSAWRRISSMVKFSLIRSLSNQPQALPGHFIYQNACRHGGV